VTGDDDAGRRVYYSLHLFHHSARRWEELGDHEKEYYISISKGIQAAAERLADKIDKEVYSQLVDQEHWT